MIKMPCRLLSVDNDPPLFFPISLSASHIAYNPRAIVFLSIFLSSFTKIGAEGKHTSSAKLVINARTQDLYLGLAVQGLFFLFLAIKFLERKEGE